MTPNELRLKNKEKRFKSDICNFDMYMYINVKTNSQFSIKKNTENILNHFTTGFYRRHDKI